MEGNKTGRFASIPDDLLLLVLARLDPTSLEEAGAVCQRWRRIVSNDGSWLRALRLEFGRRPFQRLQPSRMPTQHTPGWVSKDTHAPTWRNELVHRIGLRKLWTQAQSGQQRKHEFSVRTSGIDALIVNERNGWALAVSMSGRAAIKCNPQTGKVYARDDNTKDIVFAPEGTVSAVATRLDRIVWGMDSGRSAVSHLTRDGKLRQMVVSKELPSQKITCVAGVYDVLAQVSNEWSAMHKVSESDLIASAGGGSVLVWSATTGQTQMVLHGARNAPLSRVTWACGQRYVVGVSEAGVVLVWDLESDEPDLDQAFARAHWLRPSEDEYVSQGQSRENQCADRRPSAVFPIPGYSSGAVRVVLLAGDPFGSVFVVATETSVARVSVDGAVQTTFDMARAASASAAITAAVWQLDVCRRHAKHKPTCTLSSSSSDPDRATRLLLVGDATGSVWMFDGDSTAALHRWEHLHKRAVAALAVNAALVVSAARDGQIHTVDVLSGRTVCVDRCRSGRQASGQLDPWFWSVHPMLRSAGTQVEVRRARMLAVRSAAQWDQQVHDGIDMLDRNNAGSSGYPTMVTQIVVGYAWILAANNMHIHAAFAGPTKPQMRKPKSNRRVRSSSIDEMLAEGIEDMRVESMQGREHRLWAHETRGYVEREFERPAEELGLSLDEQMAYALWLSSAQPSGEVTPGLDPDSKSSSGPEPATLAAMSEDEQIAFALFLSRSA
ncbi:hypothetical protein GGF49_000005 [Coemansia sp. RSA 1853]|nr:hypothetical protein LPJ76_002996 [Coemansia sp. RSA 638]KAJ2545802.1 hypothetical protein GGF49_000005 [Coemansia sp. RSA 1853]